MSKAEQISRKIIELKDRFDQVGINRNYWEQSAKPFLLQILESYLHENELDWDIAIEEVHQHYESVVLSLPDRDSGIFDTNGSETKSFVKIGGKLVFSQLINGLIVVFVEYPYVKELVAPRRNLPLGTYRPQELDENLISTLLLKFLDTLIDWETNQEPYRQNIGF